MGFREEIDDSDGKYDIYIVDLGSSFNAAYGWNYLDNNDEIEGTSWVEIDNDYSENLYYTNLIFPSNKDTFLVNSWHHQGLKDIADNIHIMARSYDGLAEAAIMDTAAHPFMIAVQFHPERLGKDNGIHKQMRSSFFNVIYN